MEEDELDGLPVFGADEEECDMETSSTPKDERSGGKDADKNVPRSQTGEGTSKTAASAPSQDPAGGGREERPASPLINIKDEPIDEGYDKALLSSGQSDSSRVKEELENGDQESAPPDELRISSVFSVRGNSEAISAAPVAPQAPQFATITQPASVIRTPIVLQAQMPPQFHAHLQLQPKTLAQLQPHLQAQLQAQLQSQLQPQLQLQAQLQARLQTQLQAQFQTQLQPAQQALLQRPPQPSLQPSPKPQIHPQTQPQLPAPAAQMVRICCSGCSKVLQKGQTAFQKKGSNQLFCSTVCLTGFTLPPAPIVVPRKTCHLCLKAIANLKDLITVPIDSSNTLKEFCSLSCLSIYKSRVEGLSKDVVRCSMCRSPKEILHEVNHQGVVHRLCSDDCFLRFRSSKRISMSCCESCSNCTVTGNYHLVQVDDAIKKFCSPACINAYKQKSGKRVQCPSCQDLKAIDQMLEGTNAQGVIEFFCSARCVANSQASCTLSGASFPCTNCQKLAVPQYHLAMPDGSIRNFCTYECVAKFQERVQRSAQMNGASHAAPNPAPHPSSAQLFASHRHSTQPPAPAPTPTPRPSSSHESVRLSCKQCQKQFCSKPELLQLKNHAGVFCSRLCCDAYKREKEVKAACEYCREEKVVKDVVVYDRKPLNFCCEGCKLLYKHNYTKKHGGQCRVCAYCCNVTHRTLQNHFGGKLEEFCSQECMSLHTVLFYEMAKCHGCKNQGALKESLRWDGTVRHFCNLPCLLQFCAKNVVHHQPSTNGITSAATSLCKDMPIIGGVVSLASALAGNTAITGALPTSDASSKINDDASTQTDAAVNSDAQQRRMMKNKAIMCRPITEEQLTQCQLESSKPLGETVIDENGDRVKLVPVPIPVPTPVFIPVPVHLYTQYTPVPLGLPLPIPVPVVVSASQEAQAAAVKDDVPSRSSVEKEDVEKSKRRPASHEDQGRTYSGGLESEATSTPLSRADAKPPVPTPESEGRKGGLKTSTSSLLDLEKDISLESHDHEAPREQKAPLKRRKRGRKRRSVTDAASGVVASPPGSRLHHTYGVKAWSGWVRWRSQQADASSLSVKENVLNCSSEELGDALCHFVGEVRRPNGQTYAPDSVYYLCLGIQQHLLQKGRAENIFMDPPFNRFATDITRLIRDWERTLTPAGFAQSRVEECFLWECKQLGALSPPVLLNTLLLFGVKHLNLRTVEQHQQLSFSCISRSSRSTKLGELSYLRLAFSAKHQEQRRAMLGKRKRDEAEENTEGSEMPENTEDPRRCPVRLYEFYLSKCPDSVKERPDVFYLQPESSFQPGSDVWFSDRPLEGGVLDSMLTRVLAVRDVHLDPRQHKPGSSEEDGT
ncbi:zinc finger MYM-type protein 4 isoform X2 [Trichomycterus rosablanca]